MCEPSELNLTCQQCKRRGVDCGGQGPHNFFVEDCPNCEEYWQDYGCIKLPGQGGSTMNGLTREEAAALLCVIKNKKGSCDKVCEHEGVCNITVRQHRENIKKAETKLQSYISSEGEREE